LSWLVAAFNETPTNPNKAIAKKMPILGRAFLARSVHDLFGGYN
jgi:hypothetical protein